jgi:beta-glucosidase
MFLDHKLIIDLSAAPFNPGALFGTGTQDVRSLVKDLKAGQGYDLEIRISNADFATYALPFPFWGVIRAGGVKQIDGDAAIQQAVELAKESDG